MRRRRQFDPHYVSRPYHPARSHHPHDTRLTDQPTGFVPVQYRRHQPLSEGVELGARVAQSGHLNDCLPAESKLGADRQGEQVDAAGRDVLAHLTGRYIEPGSPQFVVQFGVDQVDLPQVRLGRVDRHSRAVLDRSPKVRVTFHAEAREQTNGGQWRLTERVRGTTTDRHHFAHRSARRIGSLIIPFTFVFALILTTEGSNQSLTERLLFGSG